MSPILFLALMAGLTALAFVAHKALRARRRAVLCRLARELQMHYAEVDHFGIARRIAMAFPIPGAADLRVFDVVYASDEHQYRYIFTAEYTRGVLARHAREARVMSFCEGKDHTQGATQLRTAPARAKFTEQYRQLSTQRSSGSRQAP